MPTSRSRRSGGSSRSKSPDYMTGDMPGLRRLVQKRLLEDVFDGASGESEVICVNLNLMNDSG